MGGCRLKSNHPGPSRNPTDSSLDAEMAVQSIQILVVEDMPEDAELLIRQLTQDGFQPAWRLIQTEPDYLAALQSPVDLILADYTLPAFSGLRALELLQERGLDIPLILISGTIGEEVAVEAIKKGAFDYLLKGKLTRLGYAVRNALKEKGLRDQAIAAEHALQERIEHSQSLLRLSRALERAQSYGEVLLAARNEIHAIVGYQNVWVYLLSEDKKFFRAVTGLGKTAEPALEELPMLTIQGDRMLEEIASGKGIVVVEDARTDERTNKEIVNALGNRTIVNVPILLFERQLGAVGMGTFGDEGLRVPGPSEREYLSALASHMAVSLDRLHLLDERTQSEAGLREVESKYRTLVERLPMIVYINPVEDNAYTIYVSPQIKAVLGFDQEEWLADPRFWEKKLHPDDRQRTLDEARRSEVTGEPFESEYRMIARDGREVWFRDQSILVRDLDGRPLHWQGLMVDITERKHAAEKFRDVLEAAPDAMLIIDEEGRINLINSQTEKMFGYERVDIVGKQIEALLPARYHSQHPLHRAEYFAEAHPRPMGSKLELHGLRKDGSEFPVEVSLSPLDTDEALLVIAAVRDITERKQSEAALLKAEKKYRNIFENAVEGIYQTTPDGKYVTANPALARMFGYSSPEELISTVTDLNSRFYVAPGRREDFKRIMEIHGAVTGFESEIYRKDGSTMWVSENGRAVRDPQGNLLYYEGITEDITSRKKAEILLRDSRANLAAAQNITHLGSWEMDLTNTEDLNSNSLRWSDEVFRIFGYQPGEIEVNNENFFRAVHPDDREKVSAAITAAIAAGAEYGIDHRILLPDGAERIVHEQSQILLDENGRRLKMLGTVQDVTESRRVEEALRQSEERYRLLFESNPQPMWVYDLQTLAFLAVNEAAVEHYGYSREEFMAMTIRDIRPPEDVTRPETDLLTAQPIKQKSGPWIHRKKNGMRIDVEVISHDIRFAGRRGRLVLANDITERKQAEQALAREQFLMRTLMDNLPDAVYFKDIHSRFIRVNKGTAVKHGFSEPEDLIGKNDFDFFERYDAERMFAEELRIIETGEPLIGIEEQETWPDRPTTWASSVKMPLRNESGKIIGTFGVSRDITERKQHERELESIARVSSALRSAANRHEMLPIILDQLMDLLKVDAAALATRDPASDDTLIELARGVWAGGSGRRIPASEGITGQVLSTGHPYLSNDVEQDPRYIPPHSTEVLAAAACVPLIAHDQTIGALWIARKQPIVSTELNLLTAISNIAASAIHRSTLFEQTQRRLEQISALHSIDIAISSSFDLRFTLNILLEQVLSHLGVDAADVLLLKPYTQVLEYVAGRGFHSTAVQSLQLRLGEGPAGHAALERRIVGIPKLQDEDYQFGRGGYIKAEKFVSYYGVPLIAKGQVKGVLEIFHRSPLRPDPDWLSFLETLADQAAIAINDATMFDNLQRSNTELILAYDATIEGWSRALDLRDNETEGHTRRVTETTLKLARMMQMSESEMIHIRRGALLHDIGKMGIPDSILLKPGPLTSAEWETMRMHPVYAYELMQPIEFLHPALDIPYCHHEKWDGSGYPRKLRADHIPLAARIFTIADVWDALLSNRPYRNAWPKKKTMDYIISESGKHFDPAIVKVFLKMEGME